MAGRPAEGRKEKLNPIKQIEQPPTKRNETNTNYFEGKTYKYIKAIQIEKPTAQKC
jgi:ribonucleotide reductase beta subunit family protein with ferritin-like domain